MNNPWKSGLYYLFMAICVIVFIGLGAAILSGCSSEVKNSDEAAERITYFKDTRTGICFAQVTSRSADGYEITSITAVDCDKAKTLLE